MYMHQAPTRGCCSSLSSSVAAILSSLPSPCSSASLTPSNPEELSTVPSLNKIEIYTNPYSVAHKVDIAFFLRSLSLNKHNTRSASQVRGTASRPQHNRHLAQQDLRGLGRPVGTVKQRHHRDHDATGVCGPYDHDTTTKATGGDRVSVCCKHTETL